MERKNIETSDPLIVALDFPSVAETMSFLHKVGDRIRWVKVGLEVFVRGGLPLVREIKNRGYSVFLDLKLHDIPNTVAGALRGLMELDVDMVSVHVMGGKKMLDEAVRVVRELGEEAPLLVGVTVLTSLDREDLVGMGLPANPREQVLLLARLARSCGLDGVVCSPQEVADVRALTGEDFLLVVPGIRWEEGEIGDQARFSSPGNALRQGADFLVVGRPITRSPDPLGAIERIYQEAEDARGKR